MSELRIAAIVEGDGEVEAVPVLVRRYAELAGWAGRVRVAPVIRQPASRVLRPQELERHIELAARKLNGPGGILVLFDCEDECPATLAPALLARIRESRPDLPTSLVLAHREFEAWFLGSVESIAGKRRLPLSLRPPPNPEAIRGCKEWLSRQMSQGEAYDETRDQPAFTALFDLSAARSACPSFDKCHREISSLLQRVAAVTPGFLVPGS